MEENLGIDELRDALKIDVHDLEHELLGQSVLFERAGAGAARAVSRRDRSSENAKRTGAVRFAELAEELAAANGKAPTVKAVEMALEADAQYQEARDAYKEDAQEAGEWEALRDAYRARGFVLRDLVQLHLSNHYGQAEEDGEYNEARRAHRRARIKRKENS